MRPLLLDLTRLVPGPQAVQMLQHIGLDVLRVASPSGDVLQQVAPDIYARLQEGKQTQIVDLKTSAGKQQLRDLAKQAAVLIESNLPGTMERLGVGPQALRALQPKLVYVRMAGYREEPWQDCPGHDVTYLAAAGLMGRLEGTWQSLQLADLCGAFWAAMAALDGLRRGGGFYEVYLEQAANSIVPSPPYLDGNACCYGIYSAAEGQVALAALEPHLWTRFCAAAGHEEWNGAGLSPANRENPVYGEICRFFSRQNPPQLEEWAREKRIPLRAVRKEPQSYSGPPWRRE